MSEASSGLLLAILSPFFSSMATILKSGATKLLHPLIVTSLGALLGSLILLILIYFSKERINLEKIRSNIKEISLMTFLRFLAGELAFAYGLSMTEGVKAIFFTKAEPYFVLFWHWLFKKEKIKTQHLLLLAVHVLGAIILSTGGILKFSRGQLGDFLVILAMGFFSLSYIPGSTLSAKLGPRIANAISLGVSGIILLPLVFIFAKIPSLAEAKTGWFYLVSYVILFNVIGLTLWFASLKSVKGWIVSALRSLGPILGIPFAYLFFGETLSVIQVVGGVIVLSTSALMARIHLAKE